MKFKIFLGIALVFLIVPILVLGSYNDVSLSTGATLRTTVGSSTINLTVESGVIQSLIVNSDSLAITLAAGSSVDLTSADKKSLSYTNGNRIANFTCGSSFSILNISLGAGYSAETIVVTPSESTCVVPNNSGGGSSSSTSDSSQTISTASSSSFSSSSSNPSSTPSTTTTTTTAVAPVTTSTTTVAPETTVSAQVAVSVPVVVLTSEINPGARSDEVITLQTLLAKDITIYPEGTVSGYYGPKTTAAVKKFQAKYGLPTVGRVGPATMAKINEVYGDTTSTAAPTTSLTQSQTSDQIQSQIQAIQQQIQALTGSSASATFIAGFGKGDKGDMVKQLQQILNSDPDTRIAESGIGSPGNETTLFGILTEKAIQKFQVKYGIAGPGDVGYGYVGPKTRTKLNELSGGSSAPLTPESPSSQAPEPTATATASMVDQITSQIKAIQDQIKALQGQ